MSPAQQKSYGFWPEGRQMVGVALEGHAGFSLSEGTVELQMAWLPPAWWSGFWLVTKGP